MYSCVVNMVEGNVIVEQYMKGTPVSDAMIKKVDGRTMSGMVRQIETLRTVESTKTDGDDLDLHRKDLQTAFLFHKEKWPGLSAEESNWPRSELRKWCL